MQRLIKSSLKVGVIGSFCLASCIAAAVTTVEKSELPELHQENQHAKATKRVLNHFTRSHYKKVSINNDLSNKVYDRFIRSLDVNKNFFLAGDMAKFGAYKDKFDEAILSGNLEDIYKIHEVSLERRKERFAYALSLLDKPFDFTEKDDKFFYDREDAPWAANLNELDEIWRQRVKYDALNLKLADKTPEETTDILTKRYERAIRRLSQTNSEDVFQAFMNSYARSIEAHTSYLSPRNSERFQMEMNLSFEGIGAVLRSEDDHTVVMSVVPGGPADASKKIKAEDKIVGVAQDNGDIVDVVGWRLDEVVELIKGPKGSKVKLQILKGSSETKKLEEVTMTRDKIKLEDRAAKSEVYYPDGDENSENSVGVITIPSFYNNLHADVSKELDVLKEKNVKGIIVDLRGNGGGALTEATLLSGLFIDKGPVVKVKYSDGRVNVNRDTDGVVNYAGPLTVLVDRYSASASEIFAAAMQDYNRALIIGEQTFGKGTVQQHLPLKRIYDLYGNSFGAVQFTIAKFYRISGGSTQHQGVVPDILYPSPIDPKEWGESKEENALPWDSIAKSNYDTFDTVPGIKDILAAKHNARTMKEPEFGYIFEDIKEYNKNKDKKYITLVEAERLEEKSKNEAKQLNRINERLGRLGLEKVTSADDVPEDLEKLDPFLKEAAYITLDLVDSGSYALNSLQKTS